MLMISASLLIASQLIALKLIIPSTAFVLRYITYVLSTSRPDLVQSILLKYFMWTNLTDAF